MRITKHNIDETTGVLAVDSPHVGIVLGDAGTGHVIVTLAMSNGLSFQFPDPAGRCWPQMATLPPGDYACTVVIVALAHGTFGQRYDSGVVIADRLVATADGAIANGSDAELGTLQFILRVG